MVKKGSGFGLLEQIYSLLNFPKQKHMPRNARPLRSFGPKDGVRALRFMGSLKTGRETAGMDRCVVLDEYGIHLVESPKQQEGKR